MSELPPQLRALLATAEPPDLGPGPRAGVTPQAALDAQIAAALRDRAQAGARAELVRAAVLLWHDQHAAAHRIVQDLETGDGSYLHGLLHRREPDYGNAAYWFRRVGGHACFPKLARRAAEILGAAHPGLLKQIAPAGDWDAFGFIRACEAATKRPSTDAASRALREVQRAEFELLLAHLAR